MGCSQRVTGTAEDETSPLLQLGSFLGLHDLQVTLSGLACLLTHLSDATVSEVMSQLMCDWGRGLWGTWRTSLLHLVQRGSQGRSHDEGLFPTLSPYLLPASGLVTTLNCSQESGHKPFLSRTRPISRQFWAFVLGVGVALAW